MADLACLDLVAARHPLLALDLPDVVPSDVALAAGGGALYYLLRVSTPATSVFDLPLPLVALVLSLLVARASVQSLERGKRRVEKYAKSLAAGEISGLDRRVHDLTHVEEVLDQCLAPLARKEFRRFVQGLSGSSGVLAGEVPRGYARGLVTAALAALIAALSLSSFARPTTTHRSRLATVMCARTRPSPRSPSRGGRTVHPARVNASA